MPKEIAVWRWYTPEPGKKKLTLTRYHLDEQTAFERFGPDVKREEATKKMQSVLLPGEQPRGNRD